MHCNILLFDGPYRFLLIIDQFVAHFFALAIFPRAVDNIFLNVIYTERVQANIPFLNDKAILATVSSEIQPFLFYMYS